MPDKANKQPEQRMKERKKNINMYTNTHTHNKN